MGRPLHVKPRANGTSRRGFFTKSGAAAMAVVATPMRVLADDDGDDDGDGLERRGGVSFEHGVASGDPLARRVILWTRVTPVSIGKRPKRVKVRYVVATDSSLRQVVARGKLFTGPERDFTVKVDADAVTMSGRLTDRHLASMMPVRSDPLHFEIASFGSVDQVTIEHVRACADAHRALVEAPARPFGRCPELTVAAH